MVFQVANYLSTHEISAAELARRIKTQKQAINNRRSMDAELLGHKPQPDPGFTSPTQTTLKHQYRASYPPLKSKVQSSSSHGSLSSITTTPNTSGSVAANRPHRSALRQSTAFDELRSESPSAKQVRFDDAETIYEPSDAEDVHTIDQLRHVASCRVPVGPSTPLSSSSSPSVACLLKRQYARMLRS